MTISQNFPSVATSLNLDFANSQQLDPRITFSRPTTAAYYDANTTALAEQNLVTQSNNLSTALLFQLSLGTATTDPTGGTTAVPLIESSSTTVHSANFNSLLSTIAGGTYTFSAFFKTGTTGRYAGLAVVLSGNGGVWAGVTVDAALGIITTPSVYGSSFSSVSATITASTNGFYRVSLTFTTASATSVSTNLSISNVYPITTTGSSGGQSYTGDGTSNIIAWGLQAEQRSSVTAYNATTTTAITNYIPVLLTAPTNQARFDHDPVARTSLGLLIEQQSTNLVTYSGALDNAVWGQVNCTVNANTKIAPDGTLTATKIVENTTASVAHYLQEGITVTTATSYTTTVYMKAGERTWGYILENSGVSAQAYFNLSTGVVGTVSGTGSPSATITSVGNGWYRCSMTFTSSGTSAGVRFGPASADNTKTYTGDGYSGVFTWGAQIEALAFPTSYIPTQASQVTRSQDLASMTGTNFSSWYNNQQGTLYTEAWSPNSNGSTNWGISVSLDDGVTGNNNQYMIRSGSYIYASSSGSSAAFGTPGQSLYKATLAYQASSYASTINGTLTTSSTITSVSNTIKQLSIGSQYVSQQPLNGWIKKIAYYPIRVTNAQLQSLTGS